MCSVVEIALWKRLWVPACWLILEGEHSQPVHLASGGADSITESQLETYPLEDPSSRSYPFSSPQFASILSPTKKISCLLRSQDRARDRGHIGKKPIIILVAVFQILWGFSQLVLFRITIHFSWFFLIYEIA